MSCPVFKGVLETPDGALTTFTLPSDYVIGSTRLFLNGVYMDACHTEGTGREVNLLEAPIASDEVCFYYLEI